MELSNFARNNRKGFVFGNPTNGGDFSDMLPEGEAPIKVNATVKPKEVIEEVFGNDDDNVNEEPVMVAGFNINSSLEDLVAATQATVAEVNKLTPPVDEAVITIPVKVAAQPAPVKRTVVTTGNDGEVRPGIVFEEPCNAKPDVLFNLDGNRKFPYAVGLDKAVSMLGNMLRNYARDEKLYDVVNSKLDEDTFYNKFGSGFYFELCKFLDVLVDENGKCIPKTPEEDGYDPDLIPTLIFLGRIYYNKGVCKGDRDHLGAMMTQYTAKYHDVVGISLSFIDEYRETFAKRLKLSSKNDIDSVMMFIEDIIGDTDMDDEYADFSMGDYIDDVTSDDDDEDDEIESGAITVQYFTNIENDLNHLRISYKDSFGDVTIPFYVDTLSPEGDAVQTENGPWEWLTAMSPEFMFWTKTPERYLSMNEYHGHGRIVFVKLPVTNGEETAIGVYPIAAFLVINMEQLKNDEYKSDDRIDDMSAWAAVDQVVRCNLPAVMDCSKRIQMGIDTICTEQEAMEYFGDEPEEEYLEIDEAAEIASSVFKADDIIATATSEVTVEEIENYQAPELSPEDQESVDNLANGLQETLQAETPVVSKTEEHLEELGIVDPSSDNGKIKPMSKKDRKKKKK